MICRYELDVLIHTRVFLADACKQDKKHSGATKGGEFLGLLSSCKILKKRLFHEVSRAYNGLGR